MLSCQYESKTCFVSQARLLEIVIAEYNCVCTPGRKWGVEREREREIRVLILVGGTGTRVSGWECLLRLENLSQVHLNIPGY